MTSPVESLSAVTLAVDDMAAAVAFYRAAGFRLVHGGERAGFTTFAAGRQYLNLSSEDGARSGRWGRVIFYVVDVDAQYERLRQQGLNADFAPPGRQLGRALLPHQRPQRS